LLSSQDALIFSDCLPNFRCSRIARYGQIGEVVADCSSYSPNVVLKFAEYVALDSPDRAASVLVLFESNKLPDEPCHLGFAPIYPVVAFAEDIRPDFEQHFEALVVILDVGLKA